MSEYLSPSRFAARVSERTGQKIAADRITYSCRAGTIRATRIGGRWWIPAAEIESYVRENRRAS